MIRRAPVAALAAVLAAAALTAGSAEAFAPAATAPIHPGVQTVTAGGQCTANFVFNGTDGSVYIGQAAHCSSTGGQTETNGCTAKSLPLGTPVTVDGATKPGTLAYNSWIRMQELGEQDPDTCAYNDLALVKLDPADAAARTNPSVPFWGGPIALNTTGTKLGDTVLSYGNSSLRQGIALLSPKQGLSLGTDSGGWNHPVYTVTPGIPGDSGSAFLDRSGRALGVLSTLALAPLPASNGVGDLAHELAYLNRTTALGAALALGTVAFRGPLL
ncbi:MAG: serine protease [Solirubrobacterales bacterium]|nr:serine protease [Solirubrobacterales bacterium]